MHTVCDSAKCPNCWECWGLKTATFMILGDVCTRDCGFCAVRHGTPVPVDREEPARIARAVCELGLKHAVITSVTRDDLPDQGAGQFHNTIRAIRRECPGVTVEVLTPDFSGDPRLLEIVFGDAAPDVYAHNLETVPRLYPQARSRSSYLRSLELLSNAKKMGGDVRTKSGIMVGLGETKEEVVDVLEDLLGAGVDMVTIGQYLKPSQANLNVIKYHTFEYFQDVETRARQKGFLSVQAGPLVRSSYRAGEVLRSRCPVAAP